MNFFPHYDLAGKHAFLSASKYAWIRYEDEKLRETYANHQQAMIGTQFHELAATLIRLKTKLPRSGKTLNAYVNDALGFKMSPEVVLYYSENIFGTADAISFRGNMLRIHDLKTGSNKVSFDQLLIYTAIFCLEYRVKPEEIDVELRLYWQDEVQVLVPALEDILPIMEKIVRFDKLISDMKAEALEL